MINEYHSHMVYTIYCLVTFLFLANALYKHSSLREGLREFRMAYISIYKKGNLLFTGNVGERKGSEV